MGSTKAPCRRVGASLGNGGFPRMKRGATMVVSPGHRRREELEALRSCSQELPSRRYLRHCELGVLLDLCQEHLEPHMA